jgi:iron(III) transport system permease protein
MADGFLRRTFREPFLLAVLAVVALGLFLFVVLPLLKVFEFSVQHEGRFTLSLYGELLSKPFNRRPLFNSVFLGALVALLGTAVGFLFAYAIARADVPGKRLFRVVATFPIISPPFVLALATILLLGRQGLITNTLLGGAWHPEIYGLKGLLLVETIAFFPSAFLILLGVLQAIDPALEESALNLGASRWQVFRTVTLPLAVPGIASALLVVFVESLADFGNPIILSGNFHVLSVQAYLHITGMSDFAGGAALAVLLLLPSLLAFSVQKYWVSRKAYVTVTGRPSARTLRPDPRVRRAGFALCAVATAGILLLYGTVLASSFVLQWGASHVATLRHYADVARIGGRYLRDTLVLAGLATPITGLLGMVIAFLVVRTRLAGRGLMEATSMLTFAVPGTVVGIGYILAFNEPRLGVLPPLTGTAAIIVLLFIFRNVPVGIRAGVAALQQIDPAIEESARNLGAGRVRTFAEVILPLISPAFFAGLAYSFVRCMTAISAVIFVVSGRWNLITVAILGLVENSDLSQAAAFSTVLILLVLVALGLIQLAVGRLGGSAMAVEGRG